MAHGHRVTRSKSARHSLKPAMRFMEPVPVYEPPLYSRLRWTFGRGSVIRTVWKSVLFHTLFAIVVVAITMTTSFELAIPSVMLTVLGVVLGFVISYRAASGYDRYWMGRTAWSDVIKNCRIMARLVWYHVPPCRTPRTDEEKSSEGWKRPESELLDVMAEKKLALELIEGYAVALKHHLRGEPGLYYEDLYDLVRPLQPQTHSSKYPSSLFTTIEDLSTSSLPTPTQENYSNSTDNLEVLPASSSSAQVSQRLEEEGQDDSSESDDDSDYRVDEEGADHQGPWMAAPIPSTLNSGHKYRPRVAGEGGNLPLTILRILSEWCSVLEDRGTVPGTSLGSILGCISSFEDTLSVMEKILTVPLPFVYSAHISTVWLFLIFLPFQLVATSGWHAIEGVAIASFIYLGFLAAGEEIEQPFGYDENDLDLDLFCCEIIRPNVRQLQRARCLNAYVSPRQKAKMKHRSMTVSEATTVNGMGHGHDKPAREEVHASPQKLRPVRIDVKVV